MKILAMILSLLVLDACASARYGYFPEGKEETVSAGQRGATFPVHFTSGTGSIHLMSLGIVKLISATKAECDAFHLRLIVKNPTGSETWMLSTRDQKLILSGAMVSIPAYLKSDTKEPPRVFISTGETRRFDLFYPLPKEQNVPELLNGFQLQWKITTQTQTVAETTTFVRQQTRRHYASVNVNQPLQHQNMVIDEEEMSPGFWWFDPLYPGLSFPDAVFYPIK